MRQGWFVAGGEVLAWWAVLVVVTLMFISSISALEVVVAAAGAMIAAVAARGVHSASGAGMGGARRWGAAFLAWPGAVLADLGRLCVVTVRALRGRSPEGALKTVTLEPGTGAAWACGVLSSTASTYVVDVSGGKTEGVQTVVVHVMDRGLSRLDRVLTVGPRR
ncbi:hypothetical protein ACFYYD_34240 [Streptomyces bluensis]|uniref:hypothetical protein n=1 Tax=Streptomyces bluensis TaxID=33897 RepID=UPI0036B972AD